MKNNKFSKLDEELLKEIKKSVMNSTGEDWKKQWTMSSGNFPFNAITGKTFTSPKTNMLLILYTNYLINKSKKEGVEEEVSKRWFPITAVSKYNLWKKPEYKDIKMKNGKTKKVMVPTQIHAWSESGFFAILYKDPLTDEIKKYSISKGTYKRDIFFLSEIKDAIKVLQDKGVAKDEIGIRCCGTKITPLLHESQLDSEKIKNLDLPGRKLNKKMLDVDDSLFKDISKAINLNSIEFDDTKSFGEAFYSPKEDKVVLPSKESFKSKEALYATTFHELIHSTGHQSRLNRDLVNSFGSQAYGKEELVAEIGSIFLCNEFGVNSAAQMQNHGEYLKNWLNSIGETNVDKELMTAFVKASKANKYINNSLTKYKELENVNALDIENDDLSSKSIKVSTIEKENSVQIVEDNEQELSDDELEIKL